MTTRRRRCTTNGDHAGLPEATLRMHYTTFGCRDELTESARREYDAEHRSGPDIRSCWRCGVTWNGHHKYFDGAPCRDCREFLRNVDGDHTLWRPDQRPAARRLAVAA
ncbi:hypothetical protein [Agromyces sp. SYSU T00194]|uniref:hypothetical protein n=1 Tax=Agromyces chitinivorans TaxID=3158560 RepID=UPI003391243C